MKSYRQLRQEMDQIDCPPQIDEVAEPSTRSIALQIFNRMKVTVADARAAKTTDALLAAMSELTIVVTAAQYLSLGETLKDKQIRSMARMLGNL